VIGETIEALGGSRFSSMQDRVESGRVYSFYRSELKGLAVARIYTRYVTAANPPQPDELYVRERQSFGKNNKEVWAVLFDERRGWEITFRGARPVKQQTLDRYRESTRRNVFYTLRQRRGEQGLVFEYVGSDIFDNQPVHNVDLIDSDNVPVTLSLLQSTRLPVRQTFFRRDPATRLRDEEETVFGKYRNVGGVQWPYAITRRRNGETVFQIFSESVEINSGLTDNLFALSADLKILPEGK
jgi:hypothetical protein